MLEAKRWLKFKMVRNPTRWGALLASAVMFNCEGFQLAGGTSEVGNPSTAILLDEGEDVDTTFTNVGVRFDFTGVPVQIIKERKPEKNSAADDSASVSGSTTSSASRSDTPSPEN